MRALYALAVALMSASAFGAEPLDQFGNEQPWRGPAEHYRVIDFAASWCKPCWITLPKLAAFAAEHSSIRVVVVDVDDKEEGRAKLIEGLGLQLPVLWDDQYIVAEHYSPMALPATYVLAPSGDVVYEQIGSGTREWEALERFLEGLVETSE